MAVSSAGCGGDSTGPGARLDTFGGDTALALAKAAGAGTAIGVAPRGFAFFDNVYPCPRRGLIDFAERGTLMQARAHGCDLGDGIILDGRFTVATRTDGEIVVGVDVNGVASVATPGGTIALPDLSVDGVSLQGREGRAAEVDAATATLSALGRTVAFDPRGAPARIFEVPADIAIANPGRDPSALTDVDVRRVVFDPLLLFSAFLFDEQLEFDRGPHIHTTECGTIDVLPDTATGLTGITASLDGCELPSGTTFGGEFAAVWTSFRETELTMQIDGAFLVDGGLPSVTLERVAWTAEPGAALQDGIFRGELAGAYAALPFFFEVPLSD